MSTFDDLLLEDYRIPRQPTPRHRAERPGVTDGFRGSLREGWRAALNVPTSTPAGGIAFRRIWEAS